MTMRTVYVGTSTREGEDHRLDGIFIYRMDSDTGHLERLHAVESGPNPSFLAIHQNKRFLFAVNETSDGAASSFRVDPNTGDLEFINRVKVGGDDPCYISLDPTGRWLLVASYSSGSLTVLPVSEDGHIGKRSQLIRHDGSSADPKRRLVSYEVPFGALAVVILPRSGESLPAGVDPQRQEKAHAHSILFDPTQNFVLAADLGMDRVWVYRFEKGRLTPQVVDDEYVKPVAGPSAVEGKEWYEYGWIGVNPTRRDMAENPPEYRRPMSGHNLEPGAGPRHLAFHPNARHLYVSNELNSTVTVFAWGGDTGYLRPVQNLSTLPEGFEGENSVAHIALTPDGRFLYVSNRGHNSLALFQIDGENGKLRPAGHFSTQGNWPRNFCLDPDGRFLLAANQESGTIVTFRIDPQTGSLAPTGEVVEVQTPVFVMAVDL